MSNALLPMDTRRQLLRTLKTRILAEFIRISGYLLMIMQKSTK